MNINTRMEDLNTVKEAVGKFGEAFYGEILEGLVLEDENRPVGLCELVGATNLIRFYKIEFVQPSNGWIEKRFRNTSGDKLFELRIKSTSPDKFFMSQGSKALNTKAFKQYHVRFNCSKSEANDPLINAQSVDVPSYFMKNFIDLPSL